MIGSCLGDLYSVNWLENSDLPGFFHTETLDSQFALLKNETDKSHVQQVRQRLLEACLVPGKWTSGHSAF